MIEGENDICRSVRSKSSRIYVHVAVLLHLKSSYLMISFLAFPIPAYNYLYFTCDIQYNFVPMYNRYLCVCELMHVSVCSYKYVWNSCALSVSISVSVSV